MAKFKKYLKKKPVGKIVYNKSGILNNIVAIALDEIDNVKPFFMRHDKALEENYRVFIDKDNIVIKVAVKVHYSCCVTEIAFKVQEAIRHNVEAMTPYHVVSVNVDVLGIYFDDEQENQPDTTQQVSNTQEQLEDNK